MIKAFTMTELIVVVVILGVIATLAIPRMTGNTEQAIATEAFSALETFHAAERRYELEHPGTYAVCGTLDLDALTPRNFNAPVCTAATGNVAMTRIGGAYTINKSIAGVFSCTGCPANLRLPNN